LKSQYFGMIGHEDTASYLWSPDPTTLTRTSSRPAGSVALTRRLS
jgi:hypothetical protein